MPALPLLLFLFVTTIQDPPASPCATWADCREQALAAAAAEEYERFHDLAWEAVRKGRRNDPELMLLLARAQSLSGRPLDALVMLRRLADLGAGTEAIASDDFRRVRALPGWAELERRLLGLPAPGTPPSPPATTTSAAAVPSSAEVTKKAAAARATSAPAAGELLRFRTPPFIPGGLAYDRVSRRFIVGDRDGQRLAVVDEFSHQIATLAGSKGAGFGEIAALEIDPRDGALWVISNGPDGGRLHKLQLISARAIGNVTTAPQGPSRFVDLALGPPGTVLVLDDATPRVLRMRAGGGRTDERDSAGGPRADQSERRSWRCRLRRARQGYRPDRAGDR